MKRIMLIVGIAMAVAVASVMVALMWPKPPPRARVLPMPNGYIDFLQGGQSLAGVLPDLKTNSAAQLREFLGSQRKVIEQIRTGLTRQCAVPWQGSMSYLSAHIADLSAIKSAGMLLIAAATADDLEGKTDAALSGLLEAVRFAHLSGREGLLIDRMVASAVATGTLSRLEKLVPKLSPEGRARLLKELAAWEAEEEAPEVVLAREQEFVELAYSRKEQLMLRFADWVLRMRGQRGSSRNTENVAFREAARRRLGITQVALAAFLAERQRAAVRLEELVPAFLPAVPTDPFSGQPLLYRRSGDSFVLYSVGPNRVDDGGRRGKPTVGPESGDLLLAPAP